MSKADKHLSDISIKKSYPPKGFKIVYLYNKTADKGVDNLLAEINATEGLLLSNFSLISVIETSRESLCVHYTEEFEQIVAGYTDGVVRFFKSNTMELLQALTDEDITDNPAPDFLDANGCVKCWNYNFSQCLYTIKEKRQTFGIAYHPRLPKFVTCGDDCKIYLYDEENRIQERIFSGSNTPGVLDGHTSRVFTACFNPRSNHELITGGWDNVIQFWDARQPFAIRYISGVHICGDGLDIHPKGTEILTCAWQKEKAIQIWDYGSGKLIQNVDPDEFSSKLYAGKYINRDHIICGGTEPNILRLMDARNYQTMATVNKLPGAVYSISLGPYKKKAETVPSRKQKVGGNTAKIDMSTNLPKIAVSSGKRIYQFEML